MKKIFDEVLGMEVEVQEPISPEEGKYLEMTDPEEFKAIFEGGKE